MIQLQSIVIRTVSEGSGFTGALRKDLLLNPHTRVAQPVAQSAVNRAVEGSNPSTGAKYLRGGKADAGVSDTSHSRFESGRGYQFVRVAELA